MKEDLIERALREELRIVNKHLPYNRPTLKHLMNMDVPYIILRDGTTHLINPEELKLISSIIDQDEYERLRLPIIIEANPAYGSNTYIIRDPIEAKVIARILGFKEYTVPLIIYNPHLIEIRMKLRTTTTIIFMPG